MRAVIPLAEASDPAWAGGKAFGLFLALRHRLPVPAGLVLTPGTEVAPAQALDALGTERYAVRSSATFEDRPGTSAAGLLATTLNVSRERIPEAARGCRDSLLEDHVSAYLRHRRIDRESAQVAVIVQAMVGPGRRGIFASLDPGGSGLTRMEEDSPDGPRVALLERDRLSDPFRAALALEAEMGGPIEIEWAESAGTIFLLQVRPAPPAVRPEPFPVQFRGEEDRAARWRWDREHNPDPLSPAQEGLVDLLAENAPFAKLRVWHGYLYVAGDGDSPTRPDQSARRWREHLAAELEAALVPWESGGPRALEDALRFFSSFYESYSPLARRAMADDSTTGSSPAVERDQELWRLARAAKNVQGLIDHLRDPDSEEAPRTPEAEDWFRRLGTHLGRWGAFAPAWDVAVPSYGEDPRPLFPVLLRLAESELSPERRAIAAEGASPAAGEEDDLYFARALLVVRRALLAKGNALAAAGRIEAPSDVFFLPLEAVRGGADSGDPRSLVREARDRRLKRGRLVPPLSLHGNERHWARPADEILTGYGVGDRARGPAALWRDPECLAAPEPGAVLVVPTISPTMTFLLASVSALVTDHGGLLDHGAFMAREYGLPAVIGTVWGTRVLRDGEELVVDGRAGRVYRVGGGRL